MENTENPSVPQVPVENKRRFTNSVKKSWLLAALVIVILLLGTGVYLLEYSNQKSSPLVTNQTQQAVVNKKLPLPPNFPSLPPSPTGIVCTHPNEQKVVFSRAGDIWAVNFDGTCLKQLTNYGKNFQPQLSPNGNKVAYYSIDAKTNGFPKNQYGVFDNSGVNIWSINTDGTNPVQLTQSDITAHRSNLAWAPTGNQLMYIEDNKVIAVNTDGTGKKVVIDLTTVPEVATAGTSTHGGGAQVNALWSPDGKNIAITCYRPEDIAGLGEGSPAFTQILLFDLNGHLLNIYTNPLQDIAYWSSINNKLYVIDADNGIGAYALESINVDGTNRQFISGKQQYNQPPNHTAINSAMYGSNQSIAVSKNGEMVATIRDEAFADKMTTSPLWIMNIDGADSHEVNLPSQLLDELKSSQLTSNNGSDTTSLRAVKWIPDNQHLIMQVFTTGFGAAVGGHPDKSTLYSMKIDGTDLKVLDQLHVVNDGFSNPAFGIITDDQFSTGVLPN